MLWGLLWTHPHVIHKRYHSFLDASTHSVYKYMHTPFIERTKAIYVLNKRWRTRDVHLACRGVPFRGFLEHILAHHVTNECVVKAMTSQLWWTTLIWGKCCGCSGQVNNLIYLQSKWFEKWSTLRMLMFQNVMTTQASRYLCVLRPWRTVFSWDAYFSVVPWNAQVFLGHECYLKEE